MSTYDPGDTSEGRVPAPPPEEILSAPPATGDLEAALAKRPRGRGLPTSTAVLVAIVLVAVGFFGGLLVGRHTASTNQTPAFGGIPSGFLSPGAGTTGGSGNGGITFGTVTRVDGDTVYVKMADGSTVRVVTSSDTQIQVSQQGTLSDLSNGSTVIIRGTQSGGALHATSISEGDLGPGGALGGAS